MKSIILHRAAVDNAGTYQDAGAELKVGDKTEAGFLNDEQAKALIISNGAVTVPAKTAG